MEFQSIASVDQANQLYLLKLKDIKFLVGAPQKFEQILNYLPNDGYILSDEETDVQNIKKKMKADGNNMQQDEKVVTNTVMNDRYITVSGKKYLKGPLKYDLSLYTAIDLSSIDYIQISNLQNIYALPYLTEGFAGFSGKIIMTRPVQQIGYEILKEFLSMNQRRMDRENQIAAGLNISKSFYSINEMDKSEKEKMAQNAYYEYFLSDNKDKDETLWSEVEFIDMFEQMGIYINEWCKMFSEEDLENCFEKVDVINYKEEVKLRHNINLNLHASGLHVGSCYWNFDTGLEKITLIDGIATHGFRHCMSCELDPLLESSTILLTNCLNNFGRVTFLVFLKPQGRS